MVVRTLNFACTLLAKFEACISSHSQNIEGSHFHKSGHVTHATPLSGSYFDPQATMGHKRRAHKEMLTWRPVMYRLLMEQ